MSQLFETIQVLDGKVQQLPFHNARCNRSRKEVLACADQIDLSNYINVPRYFNQGLVKCRISFSKEVHKVDYSFYSPRVINSIKIIHADKINYSHKYEDRTALKMLYQTRQGHSEILIIKNGLLTDCFYYNVALLKDEKWSTPKFPLLEGTKRAQLLKEGKIEMMDIHKSDLKSYSKICLFNALNEFESIVLNISQIF